MHIIKFICIGNYMVGRTGLEPIIAVHTSQIIAFRNIVTVTIRPILVGVAGFEPAAHCSQSSCATKLRYTPNS